VRRLVCLFTNYTIYGDIVNYQKIMADAQNLIRQRFFLLFNIAVLCSPRQVPLEEVFICFDMLPVP